MIEITLRKKRTKKKRGVLRDSANATVLLPPSSVEQHQVDALSFYMFQVAYTKPQLHTCTSDSNKSRHLVYKLAVVPYELGNVVDSVLIGLMFSLSDLGMASAEEL